MEETEGEEREWEERTDGVTDRGKDQKRNILKFQRLIIFQCTDNGYNSGFSWQAEATSRGLNLMQPSQIQFAHGSVAVRKGKGTHLWRAQ